MARTLRLILALATALDFLLCTSALALFSHIFLNDTKTTLWQDGGTLGFNSDPSLRIYEYANYREPPPIPAVWDPRCEQLLSNIRWLGRSSE